MILTSKINIYIGDYMKKIISLFLILTICLFVPPKVYATEKKEYSSKSYVLMNIDTGRVLKEKNSHDHLSPASVTKLMSILLILEAIDNKTISLDDTVTATENAMSKGGLQIWLEVGEKMSVNDLLKAVVIASANDACTLLGEYVAGSDEAFVNMMNNKARELGLTDTNFENCTGLDDEITNHYSCAYDLAVIASEIMKYDLITKYSTVWLDYLRNGKTQLNNTNKLINKYDGMTGLKTGTTSLAGFCLCATARRSSMSLVSVVLGCDTSEDRFDLTEELLDYGFAGYKLQKISADKNKMKKVSVKHGVEKTVPLDISDDIKVLTEKSSRNPTCRYNINSSVEAPVKKGDVLGKLIVYDDKKKIAEIDLTANKDVKRTSFLYIFYKILKNI